MKKRVIAIIAAFSMLICVVSFAREPAGIRNVILLIGDGMGPQEMGFALTYAHYAPRAVTPRRLNLELAMARGVMGMLMTSPHGAIVADSAASGTQIATGFHSRSEMIGVDKDGNIVKSVAECARDAGRSTGLVSDTRITHATPAAFYAHHLNRDVENDIARDAVESGMDVLLSGGLQHFLPSDANVPGSETQKRLRQSIPDHVMIRSSREDDENLLEQARAKGYELVFTRRALEGSRAKKILGLFAPSQMPDAITVSRTRSAADRRIPTLREMAVKAVEVLSKNEKGFFLMIESGLIDWAGHHNDAGRLLHEMLVLDDTLGFLLDWMKNRDDTMLIILADHETGGFGFSYSRSGIPSAIPLKGNAVKGRPFRPSWNYQEPGLLDMIYNQKMCFDEIRLRFAALPAAEQSPEMFARFFNDKVEFKINAAEARAILAEETNEYFTPGHKELKKKSFPLVRDFKEFYAYADEVRNCLMGRAIARRQGVVWATGTHTSTPVIVVAVGPEAHTKELRGLHHTTDVGRFMKRLME